jgi:acyl-CoA thioesterase FadM
MEQFVSNLEISTKGRLQYVFDQSIISPDEREEMVRARTFVAFVSGGRPIKPPGNVASAVGSWLAGETTVS